jgi:hypothetical protein
LTYKKALAALIIVFFAGCATVPVNSKEITEFSIKPDKGIVPGVFITAVVRTSEPVEKVTGYLDVMGSPKITFSYNAKKNAWVKVIPLPVAFQIPKGEFTAKIEAVSKSGEIFKAEKKVSTY